MTEILALIGWYASLLLFLLFAWVFIAGGLAWVRIVRAGAPERILEYLSGKRDWVKQSDIPRALNLPAPMVYTVLNQLEDEGAVVAERRPAKGLAGPRTYWRSTGTRRPGHVASEPAPEFGLAASV